MTGKGVLLAMGAFAIALSLSPAVSLAQEVDLPAKEIVVGAWDLVGASVYPADVEWSKIDDQYQHTGQLFYRVLVDGDGKETVIDRHSGAVLSRTPYPGDSTYHYWRTAYIPAMTINVDEAGDYRVELRHIEIPVPTVKRFAITDENTVVDWWILERLDMSAPGFTNDGCAVTFGRTCWRETKTAEQVTVSDYAQVYETYEFMIEDNAPVTGVTGELTGSPFSGSEGRSQIPQNPAAGLAILAIGVAGAAILYGTKAKVTALLSPHGLELENARAQNESKVREIQNKYSEWWNEVQQEKRTAAVLARDEETRKLNEKGMLEEMTNIDRMYTNEQKAVALSGLVEKYDGNVRTSYQKKLESFAVKTASRISRDEEIGNTLSTGGPTAMMIAPKITPMEDEVGTSMFNFFDSLKLKEKYGYTLADALGVCYEKNWFTSGANGLAEFIDETQGRRITEGDKYPWPLSSIVKIAASFTRETGIAATNLIGNGYFMAGAAAAVAADAVLHPLDALKNFSTMGEVLMGSLFRGTMGMEDTIIYEDPEVGAGAIMSFVIAPEELLLKAGRGATRVTRVTRKMERGAEASRAARKEGEVGMGLGERTAIKGMENEEMRSLSELMGGRMETSASAGQTFIEVSTPYTEDQK